MTVTTLLRRVIIHHLDGHLFDYRSCLGVLFDYVGQWSFDELSGIVDERYLAINVDSQSLQFSDILNQGFFFCDAIRGDIGVVQAIITTS